MKLKITATSCSVAGTITRLGAGLHSFCNCRKSFGTIVQDLMDIQGKVALVTGGASGLGAATARMIVAAGGRVVILDLNEKLGKALAAELGEAARQLRPCRCERSAEVEQPSTPP